MMPRVLTLVLITAAYCEQSATGLSDDEIKKSMSSTNLMDVEYAQIPEGLVIDGINDFDHRGRTPLMNACEVGFLKAVIQLLRGGADSNLHSRQGMNETALHFASLRGFDGVVMALLERGNLAVDALTAINDTALFIAAQAGHPNVVVTLLKAGASLQAFRVDKITPLHIAALNGRSTVVDIILKHAAESKPSLISALTDGGESVIRLAIISGNVDVIRLLLENGADPNASRGSPKEYSPLIEAAIRDHEEIVEILLLHGAVVDHKDRFGHNALHHAIENDSQNVISILNTVKSG